MGIPGGPVAMPPIEELTEAARAVLNDAVTRATTKSGGLDVRGELAEGSAAQALLQEAGKADLLVVGSRGLGGFRGLLLGSVSQQCAQHAPCPVVIVPSREEDKA